MVRKRGSKNVSETQKRKIIELIDSGMTKNDVARFYGLPKNTTKVLLDAVRRQLQLQLRNKF